MLKIWVIKIKIDKNKVYPLSMEGRGYTLFFLKINFDYAMNVYGTDTLYVFMKSLR